MRSIEKKCTPMTSRLSSPSALLAPMVVIEVAQSKSSQMTCQLHRETCTYTALSTAQFSRQLCRVTLKRKRAACSAVIEDTSRAHIQQTVLEEAPSQTVKWNWREHWYPVAYLK